MLLKLIINMYFNNVFNNVFLQLCYNIPFVFVQLCYDSIIFNNMCSCSCATT